METASKDKDKELFKILFSAAWIDGTIQPEERQYLHELASQNNLSEDPEIRTLLCEAVPIKPEDCYRMIEVYIGGHPNEGDYQELVNAVSHMIYRDSQVEIEEAKLLNRLQALSPEAHEQHSPLQQVIASLQKLYRGAIADFT